MHPSEQEKTELCLSSCSCFRLKLGHILHFLIVIQFQLNDLLDISYPVSVTGSTAPTPSSSPVSDSLGDRTANASPGYPILFPLGTSATSISLTTGITDGLSFPTSTTTAIGTGVTSVALSVVDFNIFRGNVIQAIDILDQKIRDILDVTKPTCP